VPKVGVPDLIKGLAEINSTLSWPAVVLGTVDDVPHDQDLGHSTSFTAEPPVSRAAKVVALRMGVASTNWPTSRAAVSAGPSRIPCLDGGRQLDR